MDTDTEASGCTDVIVNTHYLSEQVDNAIAKIVRDGKYKIKVTPIYEEELLGT